MFTEFAIAGGITYLYDRFSNRNFYKIKNTIKEIFKENKTEYIILKSIETRVGYKFILDLYGHGFTKLNSLKEVLENSLGCMIYIEQNKNLRTATLEVVLEKLTDETKFKPIKIEPYEVYAGLNYKLDEMVVNLNKFPHVLVSGQTGSGKSELIRLMVTNLIYNHSERDVNIYFSDLSDGCDFDIFKRCKQVEGFARNIKESIKLFKYLIHVYKKRLSIFTKFNCKNIREYNTNRPHHKMAYIYLVLDEFADYFPATQMEENYKLKVKSYNIIKNLVRKARKVGLFLIIGIQRPDTTVLDASLRSGLCTKIGFSQNNDASSLTVCDTTELTNIENREGLLSFGNQRSWFRSLYLDDKIINYYIKDSRVYNKKINKFLTFGEKKKTTIPPAAAPKNNKNKAKSKVKLNVFNK